LRIDSLRDCRGGTESQDSGNRGQGGASGNVRFGHSEGTTRIQENDFSDIYLSKTNGAIQSVDCVFGPLRTKQPSQITSFLNGYSYLFIHYSRKISVR
jgi:hypothetical protein